MLFFLIFLFTKLDQMSRVGSRGRHPKCRPKNLISFLSLPILYFIFQCRDKLALARLCRSFVDMLQEVKTNVCVFTCIARYICSILLLYL